MIGQVSTKESKHAHCLYLQMNLIGVVTLQDVQSVFIVTNLSDAEHAMECVLADAERIGSSVLVTATESSRGPYSDEYGRFGTSLTCIREIIIL